MVGGRITEPNPLVLEPGLAQVPRPERGPDGPKGVSDAIENAARAVRGQAATPEYPPSLGTYLPRYPAPLVPTSLNTCPKGLGTQGGRYLCGRPGVWVACGAGRRSQ